MKGCCIQIGHIYRIRAIVHGLVKVPNRTHDQFAAVIHIHIGGIVTCVIVQEKLIENKVIYKGLHIDVVSVFYKFIPGIRIQGLLQPIHLFRDFLNAFFRDVFLIRVFNAQVSIGQLVSGTVVIQHDFLVVIPVSAEQGRDELAVF